MPVIERGEASSAPWPEIDQSLCQGCGDCLTKCPTGALTLVDGRVAVKPDALCVHCADCEAACPRGAIHCPYEVIFADEVPQPSPSL